MIGKMIIWEGIDACGKTTMSTVAYDYLYNRLGPGKVIYTKHPGATSLGKELRYIVKHREDIEIDMKTERLIMACDNCAFIEMLLKPALAEGKIVLCDRSNFISDYAYGIAGGVDPQYMRQIHTILPDIPKADLTIVFRCPLRVARSRMFGDIEDGKQLKCRFESRDDEYFNKVAAVYQAMIDGTVVGGFDARLALLQYTNEIRAMDSTQPLEAVKEQTVQLMDEIIKC